LFASAMRSSRVSDTAVLAPTVGSVERSERVMANTGWKVTLVFGVHPKEIGRPAPEDGELRRLMGLDDEA